MKHLDIEFQALVIKYFCGSSKEEDLVKKQQILHSMFNDDPDLLDYATTYLTPEAYQDTYPSICTLLSTKQDDPKVMLLMDCFLKRMSILMIAVRFEDRPFARYLFERGATMGQLDVAGTSVIDRLHETPRFDVELGAMMLHRYNTAIQRGLVIGCGNGLGACRGHITPDPYDGNHNYIHPRENFVTIDPRPQAGPQYLGCFSDFTNDPNFMAQYRGKFEVIIFECVVPEVLDIDAATSRSRAFDAVSELLTPDGFAILLIGGNSDLKSLAQQSGFTHGRYFGRQGVLVVSKYPESIVIKSWMQRACREALCQLESNEKTFESITSMLPFVAPSTTVKLTPAAFIRGITIDKIPQQRLEDAEKSTRITPAQNLEVETETGILRISMG